MTLREPSNSSSMSEDNLTQQPVPIAWRPMLKAMADALAAGDYTLASVAQAVEPVSPETARQMEAAVRAYGATLIDLPEATWATSVCMPYGEHWDVLVDLWTTEEGPSDLVLGVRVRELAGAFSYRVELVYVP